MLSNPYWHMAVAPYKLLFIAKDGNQEYSILTKMLREKQQVNEVGKKDNSSTCKILEMIKLNLKVSKRHWEEGMEYCCIQTEEHHIRAEEEQ